MRTPIDARIASRAGIAACAVVLTTGTFLNGLIHIGETHVVRIIAARAEIAVVVEFILQ